MRRNLPSETALKVAHSVLTLSHTPGGAERLPEGTGELTEALLIAAELPHYSRRVVTAARRPYMAASYRFNDLLLPRMFEAFGHRKTQMNEWALQAIDDGIEQVVVLGAGFDTLALRLGPQHAAVHFFEVDHPATAKAKHRAVATVGKSDNVNLLAVDLAQTKLPDAMQLDSAWRAERKSLFIAEGLFMYLSKAQVRDLLKNAAACSPAGSRFAFSHCLPSWVYSTRGRIGRSLVRAVGEAVRSWVKSENLPQYLDGTGWQAISGVDDDPRHGIERYALAQRVG